jgi:hypothetical protein
MMGLSSKQGQGAIMAAVLLLGLGLGAWAMRFYFDRTLKTWDPAERLVLRLGQDLDLNAEQRERVAIILGEQKARMESRRQAWRLEVRVLAREGEDQIARVLLPSQTERFMRLHDSIHRRVDRYLWTTEGGPTAIAIGSESR